MFTVPPRPDAPVTVCVLHLDLDPDTQVLADPDALLCPAHRAQLRQVLLDISLWGHHIAEATHIRTTRDTDAERWVGSKAPCGMTLLSTLDRRSRALAPEDPISPERVLRAWAYAINDTMRLAEPSPDFSTWTHDLPMPRMSLTALVGTHLFTLDWVVANPTVVRYARHMAAVRRAITRQIPGF